jgi:ABC-type dipeptide/oligopeptide/nickel transport system permease subunit
MQPTSVPVEAASPIEIQPQEDETRPAVREVKMSKSPTRVALIRLRHDKVAMIGFGVFIFFILIAIFAPLLAKLEGQSYSTWHQDLVDQNGYPTIGITAQHWFGVEPQLGRDLFARWVYGARPSLLISSIVTLITTVIGVSMGLISGFSSGWADRIISWIVDFVLSLPFLLFAIAMPAVALTLFAGGVDNADPQQVSTVRFYCLIFVLSFFGWAGLSRLIRGQVLSLRERDFIAAARVLGVPTRRILFRELLPNLVAPIVVNASITMPAVIAAEAGLTFLGVGLIEPRASWGITIYAAQDFYQADPLYFWIPVIGVTLLVLALSLLGDGVRDAFDPKTRR